MAALRRREDSSINSIVGAGTFVRGHMQISGLLRIDGDFSGSVAADGRVIVGTGGRADCVIEAETVVIGGVFKGDVRARQKVVILASAIVFGNIFAPRLVVEEGVVFSGMLRVGAESAPVEASNDRMTKELLVETVRRRETARSESFVGVDAALAVPERRQWNG
jgi:cytoskeletal protein CcmA (bactofilin family)